jgi:hypothetical protein
LPGNEAQECGGRWEVCGTVDLDTATVAVGDAGALVERDNVAGPGAELDKKRSAVLRTREDAAYPVEKLVRGGRVIGVRVELVTDVAEVPGSWVGRGEIVVESDFVLAVDPCRDLRRTNLDVAAGTPDIDLTFANGIVHGCGVRAAPGSWRVEVFEAAHGDQLGLRILRSPVSTAPLGQGVD